MYLEDNHLGILRKFESLKGIKLLGREHIKGMDVNRLAPDEFVSEPHLLHDLIRGFYKPKGKPYILSYQATESEDNYGQQITWLDEENCEFATISMNPPNGEKDNRKKSDIEAARYNLRNGIPFGILYKVRKSENIVLGLGKIERETENGVFIVKPYRLQDETTGSSPLQEVQYETEYERLIKQRRGQQKLREELLAARSGKCEICSLDIEELLIASHIKPWRVASDEEKLNINNVLLLCANHDKLFDRGLITFENRQLKISSKISQDQARLLSIHEDIYLDYSDEVAVFLEYHKENVYLKG